MEAAATAKFVRHAPRKVNQILRLIRNKPVEKAFEALMFAPKAAAPFISKTLKSAVANSGRLKTMNTLMVKECWVGQGPTLKRMRPGPQGRGMPYKRKTCHLTIVVSDIIPGKIKTRKPKKAAEPKAS
jgi:large subunit ribosomal protein L22